MANSFGGKFEANQQQPPTREMAARQGISQAALAARSMVLAPRAGTPTERLPTTPDIPPPATGPGDPLPAAPVIPTPAPNRMFTMGAAVEPQRLETAATHVEILARAQGPQGPDVSYQGSQPASVQYRQGIQGTDNRR